MNVSVVISTYQDKDFPYLRDAVASLQTQTLHPEVIVVVGGDHTLHDRASGIVSIDTLIFDPENKGATSARNIGAAASTNEIVAFLDDDAVAEPTWCEELVKVYQSLPCGGVGGKTLPLWECAVPGYLPEEMYWLVGATHRGFAPEKTCPVRNTFANNMSFKKEVFARIGGFKEDIGFARGALIQGEEPEICDRMRTQTGLEYWYNPDAVVYNRVPGRKAKVRYLLRRAYWQGYTKRMIESDGHSLKTERMFLSTVGSGIVNRVTQAIMLGALTGATGWGYLIRRLQ